MSEIIIRRLEASDVLAYRALRLEALQLHPADFGADYSEEIALDDKAWQDKLSRNQLFGAWCDGQLVGMMAFARQGGLKSQHKSTLTSVYVKAAYRSQKIAAKLLDAVWASIPQDVEQLLLAVVTSNLPALSFYVRKGFRIYGTQPKALKIQGVYYDEYLMVKDVRS